MSLRLAPRYYGRGRGHSEAGQTADRPGHHTLGADTKGYNAMFGVNYSF